MPCDLQLQRANLVSIRFKVSTTTTRWTTDDRSTSLMELTSVTRKQIVLTKMLVKNKQLNRKKVKLNAVLF